MGRPTLKFMILAILALAANVDGSENVRERGDAQVSVELNYRLHGRDWPGLCATGTKQSPINIATTDLKPLGSPDFAPKLDTLGVVSEHLLFLTEKLPHIEVEWEHVDVPASATVAATLDGDVFAPLEGGLKPEEVKRVAIEPAQFHFHAPSESSIDGKLFDGVIHIVTFVKPGESAKCDKIKEEGGLGCPVVLAIPLTGNGTEETSPLTTLLSQKTQMYSYGPFRQSDRPIKRAGPEGGMQIDGSFNLDDLLPSNGQAAIWEGSLTTFPCTEGVLWVKFVNPISISKRQVISLQRMVAKGVTPYCRFDIYNTCFPPRSPFNNRVIQPLNDRAVKTGNVF